jgi:hypothetical protein
MQGDSLLTSFHDSCETANIGKLMVAAEIAAWPMTTDTAKLRPLPTSVLNEVLDTLGNMAPDGTPEGALRDVLVIAFEKLVDRTQVAASLQLEIIGVLEVLFPDSTFTVPTMKKGYTSGQIADLIAIAEECPSEYGMAVYMARAMLSTLDTVPYQYAHECEEVYLPPSERRGEEEDEGGITEEDNGFRVYPNPANDLLIIRGVLSESEKATFELQTVTGSRLKTVRLKDGKTQIDVSDLPSGLYIYRILVNEQTKTTGKQVIIR